MTLALALLLVVAGGILLWRGLAPRSPVVAPKREVTQEARDLPQPLPSPADSSSKNEEGQREFVENLVHNWQGFSREQLEPFLAQDPGNPERWSTAYDLTEDSSLLDDALQRFPDNRSLLMRSIVRTFREGGDIAAVAEHLKRVDPDSSLGNYALAARAAREGDVAAVSRELSDALTKSAPVLLTAADIVLRRAAIESTGIPAGRAGIMAFCPPYDMASFTLMAEPARFLLDRAPSDPALAEQGIAFTEHLRMAGSTNFASDLFAVAMQYSFLEQVDPDLEFGDSGLTIGAKLAELEDLKQRNFDLLDFAPEFDRTATPEEVRLWADTAMVAGPRRAYQQAADTRNRQHGKVNQLPAPEPAAQPGE